MCFIQLLLKMTVSGIYSRMGHFDDIDFFENMKWQTILHVFMKSLYSNKLIIFVKLRKQNVVCAHEFSWFAKKVVCTTYDVMGISALISGAICVENNIFSQSETVYFSALFL